MPVRADSTLGPGRPGWGAGAINRMLRRVSGEEIGMERREARPEVPPEALNQGGHMQAKLWSLVALALLVAACAISPNLATIQKAKARRDLAALYLRRAEPEIAILEYRKALELYERDAETHFGLGEAYRRKQEFALAEEHFLRSLSLQPGLLPARLNLGALYIQQERWADAISATQLLLEDPTFMFPGQAYQNLGWAHYRAGDLAEAEVSLKQSISINPRNPIPHLILGIVSNQRGELAASISEFEAVIRILSKQPPGTFSSTEAEARFRLAETHARLGQQARAIEHLRAAVERGGESEWGRRSRDFLRALE
ncbi:MAG: tetratricopeptide repeat protein [Myxococcota bacterium]|nr:tetratricopeptide repeat protein [Myxococcota bacterium]